ncbi:glycoside hydrolase [Sulfurovum sp. NBC37-1]|nr:glycoside hydrolase [Sulfurovum sp. NBC37-1]
MDVSLKLSFLWHMHQPNYVDENGIMCMPWVFLHAIKDYYEMPWLLSRFPRLKATFNLTPTLIRQLKLYEAHRYEKDKFLTLWIREVSTLEEEEKKYLVKLCRSALFETMVKPLKRYAALYHNENFTESELRDLEVLFLLAWCGNYLRQNSTVVQTLIRKETAYTQSDKEELLDALLKFIPQILPFYGSLLQSGQISLSTTPYNHPILPLLIDMQTAVISNPKTTLPQDPLSLKDDARKQVDKAIELYTEVFGQRPTGLWPAEGAVDEKSLHLYRESGIQWIATDEAILLKTLSSSEKSLCYQRYEYDSVFIAFRDHALSDSIGFRYRFMEEEEAVKDFMKRLDEIGQQNPDASVFVIVDGENAWEFYRNNAMDFFLELYDAISKSRTVSLQKLDEAAKEVRRELSSLQPGSWIYGTFDTWVGQSEKNRAWELIYKTKRETASSYRKLDKETKALADEHFLASECSDWFWWYGEDHYSDFLEEFDTLFRLHLIAIYELCRIPVPSDLYLNIFRKRNVFLSQVRPQFPLSVEVDGKESSFYEWLGAGMIDESKAFSTMDGAKRIVQKLYYGENETMMYFRLDVNVEQFLQAYKEIKLHFKELADVIVLPVATHYQQDGLTLACKDMVEFSIDKKYCQKKSNLHLQLEITDKQNSSEFVPIFGDIEVCLDDYSKNWFI